MIAQVPTYTLPFSILDYGLTALALIAMVAITYFFVKFLRDNVKQQQGGVTDTLKTLVVAGERHTEVTRGMMNEFYRFAEEMRELRQDAERQAAALAEHRARLEAIAWDSRLREQRQMIADQEIRDVTKRMTAGEERLTAEEARSTEIADRAEEREGQRT